jgi:hypothetical protein
MLGIGTKVVLKYDDIEGVIDGYNDITDRYRVRITTKGHKSRYEWAGLYEIEVLNKDSKDKKSPDMIDGKIDFKKLYGHK